MLRASLVFLLLAPASALYWLEDAPLTDYILDLQPSAFRSFTRQYCLGKSSRANYFCLTTLDIPDRSL